MRPYVLALPLFLIGFLANCQTYIPDSGHVVLYFPQLADGGPKDGQWQTRFTILNPNGISATVNFSFYSDSGGPLRLDFGAGLSNTYSVTIPPGGSRSFQSRVASATTLTGWSLGQANVPVQASVAFRQIFSNNPKWEITVHPTLPTPAYISAGNRDLGIAIANIHDGFGATVLARVFDRQGTFFGQQSITLGPLSHLSFNLSDAFPTLPASFNGTVVLTAQDVANGTFVAWTLNSEAGALSSFPDGRVVAPISQYERILLIYDRVLAVAQNRLGPQPVQLRISADPAINAFGNATGIQINLALAELINDSESELAFAIAHELGHVYQGRTGRFDFIPSNAEFDADLFGALIAISAGFDPYGAAGPLAKLALASGSAGLLTQFESQSGPDLHKSFNTRLENIYGLILTACNFDAPSRQSCDAYRSQFHPHFPPSSPLSTTPEVR